MPGKLDNVVTRANISSGGGLVVEQWSNNKLLSATVDQIPLGAMIYILNKKESKVYRRVL